MGEVLSINSQVQISVDHFLSHR